VAKVAQSATATEGGKKTRRGGGVELCFQKRFFLTKINNCYQDQSMKSSESDRVQSFSAADRE